MSFALICSVDIIEDRKLLTIASSIVFKNSTNKKINIIVKDQSLNLIQGQLVPIPVHLTNEIIVLEIDLNQSKQILLEKVL